MTEKEKRDRGDLYNINNDPVLLEELNKAKDLCHEYNLIRPSDSGKKKDLLKKLLGKMGEPCTILSPFWCDYGYNIEIGDHFMANHNCTILDGAKVTFGNDVFVGPDCSFYTSGYPLDVVDRIADLEYARPITIGDHVWIGGGVRIMPGVQIGNDSVIGGGSIVVSDIPAGVLAAGNPCRLIRPLDVMDSLAPRSGKRPASLERLTASPDSPAADPEKLTADPASPADQDGPAKLASMNKGHEEVEEWALSFIDPDEASRLLDIDCGDGARVERLARFAPQAHVTGLDSSPHALEAARSHNEALIAEGKADILEASPEALPFTEASFDYVTCVESFYSWPDPQENLEEIRRVLKPGGRFLLVSDSYGKVDLDQALLEDTDFTDLFDLFNPSKEDLLILFRNAGFIAVKTHLVEEKNWICVEGIK